MVASIFAGLLVPSNQQNLVSTIALQPLEMQT